MQPAARDYTPLDRCIAAADQALKTLFGQRTPQRPYPAESLAADGAIDEVDRRRVIALMRINHAGEVAAQALYSGQAFTAQNASTCTLLLEAAAEETDHLSWCETRLQELGGRTSYLDPLWYLGSFAIGSLAGIAGDKTSLGFVAETEQQVSDHLSSHLRQLPMEDARSRAVLEQMLADEAKHGQNAQDAGAGELPTPVRTLMRATAKIMTRTAAWI